MSTVAKIAAWQRITDDGYQLWDEIHCILCFQRDDEGLRIVTGSPQARLKICRECAEMIREQG